MKFLKVICFSFFLIIFLFSFDSFLCCNEYDEFCKSFIDNEFETLFDSKVKDKSEFLDKIIQGYGFKPNKMNRYLFFSKISQLFEDYKKTSGKEFSYEEFLKGLNSSFDQLAQELKVLGKEKNKSEKTDKSRFFKKRYLAMLVGFLGFLGINISLYFKMSDLEKNKDKNLADLKCKMNKKIKESLTELEKINTSLQQNYASLDDKINIVNRQKAEEIAGACGQNLNALEKRVAEICDQKLQGAGQIKEECRQEVQIAVDRVLNELEKNKKEVIASKKDFEEKFETYKKRMDKIADGIDAHCKKIEEGFKENGKSFWSDLFSVNFNAEDGIKGVKDMITLANKFEDIAKVFAGENTDQNAELRKRLDILSSTPVFPAVPKHNPTIVKV